MRRAGAVLFASLCAAGLGCARGPQVSTDALALKRVVVYRNGVGYFERAGRVDGDQVKFRMRAEEVGDFLATLAVIERGGSSVRAASFPLHQEKPEPEPPPPAPPEAHPFAPRPPVPAPPPKKPERDRLETVVLDLDGKRHDLQVGYIAATPVWRPSYRLVLASDGADLQAWGIVQNLSGEDWKDVSLSLVAGAPVAFEATLGTPVIPERPTVTDQGEVIAAVPRAETSLRQDAANAPVAAPAPAPPAEAMRSAGGVPGTGSGVGGAQPARKAAPKPSAPSGARMAPMAPPTAVAESAQAKDAWTAAPSAPRNLSALAAVAVEGGATRYDIPSPVTVPDESATMVMLLAKRVPGEAVFLFAPDGGVPDSSAHPFRVARFTNKTGGLLERGPIAVFEQGAFLGQGIVDPLPDGATTTVPFALERSLAVETERTHDELGARLAKIEAGAITIERDVVARTKYRVRNGGDAAARVLVKHPRAPGTRLHDPPKGTEDNVGTGSALVPADAPAHATAELVVDERQAFLRGVDWLSPQADEAVKGYLADPRADAQVAAQLRAAWDVREALVKATRERDALVHEHDDLEAQSEETRRNLKTIEKNRTAADLRQKLTDRLAKNAARLDEIGKRRVELDMQIDEQRVRFTDLVRAIRLSQALPPRSP